MIAIIDYGCGNLNSIKNMLKKIGFDAVITKNAEGVSMASKIILPGVGAFDTGMRNLEESGLLPIIQKKAMEDKIPFLGICLGMQLMTKGSEEGQLKGLGWFDADTLKFPVDEKLKVPNMGWNFVDVKKNGLFAGINEPRFYFVHSYYIKSNNPEDISATAEYGLEYTCGFSNDNLFGVQFHPEKSHKYGMKLLLNFASL
jgi:imidazole glycerol-phosphate synthase subunit HisH